MDHGYFAASRSQATCQMERATRIRCDDVLRSKFLHLVQQRRQKSVGLRGTCQKVMTRSATATIAMQLSNLQSRYTAEQRRSRVACG